MRARKHGRSARLRPRETPGRMLFGFGSPLFWQRCEALEILLTRFFAEQYYKTREGSRPPGYRLSVDPLLRSGERRAPPPPPPGRRRWGPPAIGMARWTAGRFPRSEKHHRSGPPRDGRSKALCRRLGPTSLALRSGAFPCRLVLPSPHDGISGEPHANVLLTGSVRGDALPVRSRSNSLRGGAGKDGGGDTLQLGEWREAIL